MSTTGEQPTIAGEAPTSAEAPPARSQSLWRNRDYLILWSGQTISSFGTQISGFAFPLLVLSPFRLGCAGGLSGRRAQRPLSGLQPAGGRADRPLGPQARDDPLRQRA